MATKEPQGSLLEPRESIPEDRQHTWQEELIGDMPKPFTGAAPDYRRWRTHIRNWVIINGVAPGDIVAAAVLLNVSYCAKHWAIFKKPRLYSTIDGAPDSAAATIEAIFKDMNVVFTDTGAYQRAIHKLYNSHQETRPAFDHNTYYSNLALELGHDPHSLNLNSFYIASLCNNLKKRMEDWDSRRSSEKKPRATLHKCMQEATCIEGFFPAPQKRRQRKSQLRYTRDW